MTVVYLLQQFLVVFVRFVFRRIYLLVRMVPGNLVISIPKQKLPKSCISPYPEVHMPGQLCQCMLDHSCQRKWEVSTAEYIGHVWTGQNPGRKPKGMILSRCTPEGGGDSSCEPLQSVGLE